ncbi:MAG: hypothetical protein ABSF86_23260 [Steroidobacteraceae bacterium]|jgi:hypothetical protein
MSQFNPIGRLVIAMGVCLCCALASLHALAASGESDREAWIAQASVGLPPQALDALSQISGADRRLLALRAYLKAGDALAERWTWSQSQQSAYPGTAEGKAALVELDAVAAAFAVANPGFTLQVNRRPRSLEAQITGWNENASVGTAAAACASALERQFDTDRAPPSAAARQRALIDWEANGSATLAAPGLSAHGQAHSFAFQVERGGELIAGTDAASARAQWDEAGWTQKLQAAVKAAGNHFTGPLQSPYEPWHYAYLPAASQAR